MIYSLKLPLAGATIATNQTFVLSSDANLAAALQSILQQIEIAVPLNLDELLAAHGQIAVTWSLDDVAAVRPDLTEAQAMQVLAFVRDYHDRELGITWQMLKSAAESLFGAAQ